MSTKTFRVKATALMLVGAGCASVFEMGGGEVASAATTINPSPTPFPGPFTSKIEGFSAYDGQTKCIRKAKPGVVAFEKFVLRKLKKASFGIARSCSGSSVSEHKEGRAIDWHMNAYNWRDRQQVKKLFRYLFKTDWWGNPYARARRLGIMYIIWNKKMWRAYRPFDGWQKYEGSSPHTDHVHISFARAGANGVTSFWTGEVAKLPEAWIPGWPPEPTPTPPNQGKTTGRFAGEDT